MAIVLDGTTLPDDLIWVDEYDWTPVQQSVGYTLSGALLVQTGAKLAGRPITLSGGADHGWALRSLIDTLQGKLSIATAMTLILHDARSFDVLWRHGDKPLEAKPVTDYSDPGTTDPYVLTLRLMTA